MNTHGTNSPPHINPRRSGLALFGRFYPVLSPALYIFFLKAYISSVRCIVDWLAAECPPAVSVSCKVQRAQDEQDGQDRENHKSLYEQSLFVANGVADLPAEDPGLRLDRFDRHVGTTIFPVFSVLSHAIAGRLDVFPQGAGPVGERRVNVKVLIEGDPVVINNAAVIDEFMPGSLPGSARRWRCRRDRGRARPGNGPRPARGTRSWPEAAAPAGRPARAWACRHRWRW